MPINTSNARPNTEQQVHETPSNDNTSDNIKETVDKNRGLLRTFLYHIKRFFLAIGNSTAMQKIRAALQRIDPRQLFKKRNQEPTSDNDKQEIPPEDTLEQHNIEDHNHLDIPIEEHLSEQDNNHDLPEDKATDGNHIELQETELGKIESSRSDITISSVSDNDIDTKRQAIDISDNNDLWKNITTLPQSQHNTSKTTHMSQTYAKMHTCIQACFKELQDVLSALDAPALTEEMDVEIAVAKIASFSDKIDTLKNKDVRLLISANRTVIRASLHKIHTLLERSPASKTLSNLSKALTWAHKCNELYQQIFLRQAALSNLPDQDSEVKTIQSKGANLQKFIELTLQPLFLRLKQHAKTEQTRHQISIEKHYLEFYIDQLARFPSCPDKQDEFSEAPISLDEPKKYERTQQTYIQQSQLYEAEIVLLDCLLNKKYNHSSLQKAYATVLQLRKTEQTQSDLLTSLLRNVNTTMSQYVKNTGALYPNYASKIEDLIRNGLQQLKLPKPSKPSDTKAETITNPAPKKTTPAKKDDATTKAKATTKPAPKKTTPAKKDGATTKAETTTKPAPKKTPPAKKEISITQEKTTTKKKPPAQPAASADKKSTSPKSKTKDRSPSKNTK